jgi:hypothetical protein
MPTGVEKNPTPILDLEVPLPPRRFQLGSQLVGFVFGLGSTLIFLTSIRGDSGHSGVTCLIFLAAIFGAILIHEIGHLLAGWIVGFHFNSIQVAWLSLGFEYGKLTLRVRNKTSLGGYATIQIDRIYRLRKRLMFFIAGGPAASILSVVVIAVTVNVFDLHKSWLAAPAASLTFVCLLLSMVNLLPFSTRGYSSDGARLEMLITSRDKARRWFCLAALGNAHRRGRSPRLLNSNWTKAATSVRDNSIDEVSACWLAYICASERKQADVAADYLERCLKLAGIVDGATRDTLILEAAVFQAWERDNIDKSAKWLSHVRAPRRMPKLMQLRSTIAMNCAKRDFESAHANWGEGLAFIEKLPPTPLRDSVSVSWSEWLIEIRERQGAKASSAIL